MCDCALFNALKGHHVTYGTDRVALHCIALHNICVTALQAP